MDENVKKSPQIRFEGFTDAWEQYELGKIGTTFTGLSGKTKEDFGHGDAKFVTYVNVFGNTISNPEILESIEIDSKQNSVQYGDVFFTTSSETPEEVGMSSVWLENRENVYLNSFCFGYRPTEKFDPYYLAFVLRSDSVRKKFMFLAQGISRYNISKTKAMEMTIPIPELAEQEKVGEFFKTLDQTITFHQRKLDLLEKSKKAYLQKMFPKNGEDKPEIRFDGFTEAWEQCRLSDVIEKLTGGASIEPNDYQEIGIRTIPKGAVNESGVANLSGSKFIGEDFYQRNITSSVSVLELVTSLRDLVPSAPNMGRIVRIVGNPEEFLMPQGVYSLKLNTDMDEDFLISYSNTEKYRRIISAEKNGSTQVHIRNGEFLNINIPLPKYKEQKAIGTFFQTLDTTITFYQRKLDLLAKSKKAYLQKMFPKNGEDNPEIRFDGFTEAWEQCELSNITDILDGDRGKNYPSGNDFFEYEHTLFLSASNVTKNGFLFESNQYITEEKSNSLGNGKIELDDIVLTSRGSLGNIAWYNDGIKALIPYARINSGMLILRVKQGVVPSYIAQYLKSPIGIKQIDMISFGSAQPQLTKKDVSSYKISLPKSAEEQKAIGSFFSTLDQTITFHQRELELLKKMKKSLLQKMFI